MLAPKKQNAPIESGRTFLQEIMYHKIKFCQGKSSPSLENFLPFCFQEHRDEKNCQEGARKKLQNPRFLKKFLSLLFSTTSGSKNFQATSEKAVLLGKPEACPCLCHRSPSAVLQRSSLLRRDARFAAVAKKGQRVRKTFPQKALAPRRQLSLKRPKHDRCRK